MIMSIRRARIIEVVSLVVFTIIAILVAFYGKTEALKALTVVYASVVLLFDIAVSRCPHCGIHINYTFGRCCKHCGNDLYEE